MAPNSLVNRKIWFVLVALAVSGCNRHSAKPYDSDSTLFEIARGVTVRKFSSAGVHLLDMDLSVARARAAVVAESVRADKGRVFGESLTLREWCESKRALAGINGGFFGVTVGTRKEIVGLLARNETVLSTSRLVRSPRNPNRRIVRSVLGFDKNGTPHIGWAVGQRGRAAMLTEYLEPLNPVHQRFWTVDSAVGCGPRLIRNGRIDVTDREERLVNPPALPRTFVGYNMVGGKPRRLVMGIAESMTFRDAAGFLDGYFRRQHGTACAQAMCLDGGASSQLCYRGRDGFVESNATNVSVPTAVLVLSR